MSESAGTSKRSPLRIIGMIVGAIIALVVVGIGAAFALSSSAMNKTYDVTPAPLEVKPTPDLVERGKEIATFRGCLDCHGENLAGRVVADAMPVMVLAGPNITPGGVVKEYSDEDWARAIRHGIGPDAKPLMFMPSHEYSALSHKDLASIIAYMRSVPAVAEPAQPFEVGPLGRLLYLGGDFPLIPAEFIDHAAVKPASPTRGPTAEYGKYLSSGCIGCHGEGLSGGPIPGVPPDWPPAANLTPHESGLKSWSFEDFKTVFRTGKRPDGREIKAEYMPIKFVSQASTDDDLKAMWEYLKSVPAQPIGNR